jgi:hypothetical protein
MCQAPLTYSVLIQGGLKNPSSVVAITGSFTVETRDSNNFIVSQGLLDNSVVAKIKPEPMN